MLLLISGSPHPQSANSRFLNGIGKLQPRPVRSTDYLADLPVFQPGRDTAPWPEPVLRWRSDVDQASALVFATPAYLHNIPGVLKNALDWLASSGELDSKPALVFTFTPRAPRGEKARQSLLWSLSALNVRVVAEEGFYQSDINFGNGGEILPGEEREILSEALLLL
ncbi:NADPH-dependent FMN reductase [Neolewinella aurantiaca]|nr:NADPH-dependent FMN reductase [Neolewinella aurantiaca]